MEVFEPAQPSCKRRCDTPGDRYRRMEEGYKKTISELEKEIQYLRSALGENQITSPDEYPSFVNSPVDVDEEVPFSETPSDSDNSTAAAQLDLSLKNEAQVFNYGISMNSTINEEHPIPPFILPIEKDKDSTIANEANTKSVTVETADDITATCETLNSNTTDTKTEDMTYGKTVNLENKDSDEQEQEEELYTGANTRFADLLSYALSVSKLKSETEKEAVNSECITNYIKHECERYTEDIRDGLQVLCETYLKSNTGGSVEERLLKGALFGMVFVNLQGVLSAVHNRFLKRIKKNNFQMKDTKLTSSVSLDNISDGEVAASQSLSDGMSISDGEAVLNMPSLDTLSSYEK